MIQDQSQSSFGLQPNVAAGIAAFFLLIGGLIILLGKPAQQWVRFVAVQSIVFGAIVLIFNIAFGILAGILLFVPGAWTVLLIVWWVFRIAVLVGWLVTTIKAFQGSAYRLPIIGDLADRWVPASANL
jgi:uncharacterized membrane protein